jgi:UDP-hydrolysing UDP-N-acetyl-D-glucosamine 2-epimerase
VKKIGVITGSRAEYGLLSTLIRQLRDDPAFDLQVYVTGSHLSSEYGMTVEEIRKDGIAITDEIDVLMSSGSPTAIAKAVALATIGFSESLRRNRPDVVVILGDRFEIFGAAQAAAFLGIPIAHIHGGEITEGTFDEFIRHAITKMSQLHFTANEHYRARVIQLGERPETVFNVGAPGLDQMGPEKTLSRAELSQQLKFPLHDNFVLFTFHPETLEFADAVHEMDEALKALNHFPELQVILTFPNADSPSSHALIQRLEGFRNSRPEGHTLLTPSLGRLRYISAMKLARAIIGNSSSGIIEAPFFKVPTVNIGNRQKGRIKADSVIDTVAKEDKIVEAIQKALEFSPEHLRAVKSVYGDGTASRQMLEILKQTKTLSVRKPFYDVEGVR